MSTNLKAKILTVGKNDPTADYNTVDFDTDWNAIRSAAIEMSKRGGGEVRIRTASTPYDFNRGATPGLRLNMPSNVTITGKKKNKVIIKGTVASDYMIFNPSTNGSNIVENFVVKNITFDCDNVTAGSAIGFVDTNNSGAVNCVFKNGATNGWLTKFGTNPSSSSNFIGKNNFTKNCLWDTHQGSLEMNLVFNQDNFIDENPIYTNKGTVTGGPIFGLWQRTKNAKIINPRYINNNGFNYYSNSCDYTVFQNIYAENTGCILQGSNIPDNLNFGPAGGINRAIGLTVNGLTAIGGANSSTSSAIQLGAVRDYNIKIDHIENYESAIIFSRGNNTNSSTAYKGRVQIGTIKNCN